MMMVPQCGKEYWKLFILSLKVFQQNLAICMEGGGGGGEGGGGGGERGQIKHTKIGSVYWKSQCFIPCPNTCELCHIQICKQTSSPNCNVVL